MLEYKTFGDRGPYFILLHGLFASKENLFTLGKGLSGKARILIPDLRNHGDSFHADSMSYDEMAVDIIQLMDFCGVERSWLLGHSMGGKVAMSIALQYPDRVSGLVVEDIAPKKYEQGLEEELQAMRDLPLEHMERRKDAEDWMVQRLENRAVAGFLLKNIQRNDSGGFFWRLNLNALQKELSRIRDFPPIAGSYTGTTLFIRGGNSHYMEDGDADIVKKFFPGAEIHSLNDTSHWVHAERPQEVLSLLLDLSDFSS